MLETYIGIDFGKRRIGISSGQQITKTATPVSTVSAKDGIPDWIELDKIIANWRPSKIIIGLPIDAKDKETEITKEAKLFSQKIENRYSIKVHLINEAFSTREARWRIDEMTKKNNNHLKVDAMAACVILETWMNSI